MPEYNFNHFREDLVDNSYANYHDYELFMEALLLNSPYKKMEFLAKKGDVLIWSANIIHGGSPVIDPHSTRLSQVTHYYFKDCIYYSPMSSNTISGELQVRTNLKNMRTGMLETSTFNGQLTTLVRTHKSLYSINAHLVYPPLVRHLSDFWYVFKINGLKGLLNDLFIKLRVILFKLGLKKEI